MTQTPSQVPSDHMTRWLPLPPRSKLRKTRSIPDMFNGSSISSSSVNLSGPEAGPSTFTGRAHSHSVTGADMPRLPAAMVDVGRAPNGDIFGGRDAMDWHHSSIATLGVRVCTFRTWSYGAGGWIYTRAHSSSKSFPTAIWTTRGFRIAVEKACNRLFVHAAYIAGSAIV